MNKFSRIALIGYSFYLLVEMAIYPLITKVPPLLPTILNVIYIASFIAVAAWIMSHDKNLKKPATFIIIAAVLSIINKVVIYYHFHVNHIESSIIYSLVTSSFYIPALIFKCMGFFKLSKKLPQGNTARYMAKFIPWTELTPLIISSVFTIAMLFTTIPNMVLRLPNTIMFLAEILAMAIFCYYLPKAIEHKEEL